MKRLFTFTLIVFVLHTVSIVAAAQQLGTVAAWNQQGVEFNTTPGVATPVHKRAALRAAIAAMNADVIALSEVNSRADLNQVVSTPINGIRYRVDMDNDQLVPQKIAVLFRDRPGISVSNRRPIPGSDDNLPERNRKAYAFDVRIRNFDFILIAVHLKSGRDTTERTIRSRQASAIAAFIRHEIDTKPEKDVLVVGDYNMVPVDDALNFDALSPGPVNNELLRYISSEVPGHPPTHIGQCHGQNSFSGNRLDGFGITAVQTHEWNGFVRALPLHRTLPMPFRGCPRYKSRVSDHIPLVAKFRIAVADDD